MRMRSAVGIGAVALGLLMGLLPAPATATTVETDWPTARFVPQGTGYNPHETVLSPSTVGDLELAWSFQTEGPVNTTPIVVDGVVYVAGQVSGTGGSEVNAIDAETGEPLWSERDGGYSPPDLASADGTLYVSFLTGHILRAYNAVTGELRWEFPGPTMAPTVVGGVVYAADHLRSLWAIDAQTGRKRWVTHARLGGFGVGVAVARGVVYAGGHEPDGTSPVYAFDATTGALIWRTMTGGSVDPTPAVANGTVFASSGDQLLYALNARTGRIRWTADIGGAETSSPAVANGVVYVGSSDSNVYAFDAVSGGQLWATPVGGA
jgi:outer membrane protein assembly factor BamB